MIFRFIYTPLSTKKQNKEEKYAKYEIYVVIYW